MSFVSDAIAAIAPARVVDCRPEHLPQIMAVESLAWGDPESAWTYGYPAECMDWGRSFALEADGQMVGFGSAWGFEVPVPGGRRVATSGLTWVGVHPGYRRRGLLKALLARHFEDALERGEPVSMLWASETAIYSRFGYGMAGRAYMLTLPKAATLRDVPGSNQVAIKIENATFEAHGQAVQQIAEAAGQTPLAPPGWTTPPNQAIYREFFYNREEPYPKQEPVRIALAVKDGQPSGYALFKRECKWQDGKPDGTLEVLGLVALDPASHHQLWFTMLNMDLQAKVKANYRALDDPVVTLLENPRDAGGQVIDTLHVRILDLPAALAARGYALPIDVVLEVTDRHFSANAGRWRLTAQPGQTPQVVRADGQPADLAMTIRDLGAVYLGGPALASLVAAGLVTELTPGSAALVSQAFKSQIEPAAPYSW